MIFQTQYSDTDPAAFPELFYIPLLFFKGSIYFVAGARQPGFQIFFLNNLFSVKQKGIDDIGKNVIKFFYDFFSEIFFCHDLFLLLFIF